MYEILINKKAMYKAKRMSITNPEFYVIYNGKEDYPEKTVIKLSDLYETKGVENNLELIVTVYNVNKGKNTQMMEQSSTLNEYAAFVAKVREHEATGLALTEALKKAIEDCVRDNILREFLQKHGGDVVNMLYREWNLDDALEVREEETKEEIAENMLDAGMTLEQIKKLTKLPLSTIKRLKKQKQNQ